MKLHNARNPAIKKTRKEISRINYDLNLSYDKQFIIIFASLFIINNYYIT